MYACKGVCVCAFHFPTYLMNLISAEHHRFKLLVASHISTHHTNTLWVLLWAAFAFFNLLWGIVRSIDKITTHGNPVASGGWPGVSSSVQHREGPKRADVFRDGITDLKSCESFMLKDAPTHESHLPYHPWYLLWRLGSAWASVSRPTIRGTACTARTWACAQNDKTHVPV